MANSKYCGGCSLAYIRADAYTGYCKYSSEANKGSLHPKSIEIFDTCEHWEKKTKNADTE